MGGGRGNRKEQNTNNVVLLEQRKCAKQYHSTKHQKDFNLIKAGGSESMYSLGAFGVPPPKISP